MALMKVETTAEVRAVMTAAMMVGSKAEMRVDL